MELLHGAKNRQFICSTNSGVHEFAFLKRLQSEKTSHPERCKTMQQGLYVGSNRKSTRILYSAHFRSHASVLVDVFGRTAFD